MNYNDFIQGIMMVKSLIGGLHVPADENHVQIVGQIHGILNSMRDECQSKLHQEMLAKQAEAVE